MDIPPELITNILYRLPAKSLGRFKCVSKDWLTQISEPQFIKAHQNTYNRHHLICDSHHDFLLHSLPVNHHADIPNDIFVNLDFEYISVFFIRGSCNGLVLAYADNFVSSHWLAVFNPTTMESVYLPLHKHDLVRYWESIDMVFGFGYDSFTDDYKVVTISYFHDPYYVFPPGNMHVHVYSLRNETWRQVNDSPYCHFGWMRISGVFVHGFLHWIADKTYDDQIPVLVAFSFADETFSQVPTPKFGNGVDVLYRTDCRLVVVGEKLGIFVGIGLWLMNEYGVRESWTKIIIYGLYKIPIVKQRVETKIIYEDGKILLVSNSLMWIYDVEDKSFGEAIDISRDVKGLKVKGSYVESLVSPISVTRIGN